MLSTSPELHYLILIRTPEIVTMCHYVSLYRWRNQGTGKWSDLPKVTTAVHCRDSIWTQVCDSRVHAFKGRMPEAVFSEHCPVRISYQQRVWVFLWTLWPFHGSVLQIPVFQASPLHQAALRPWVPASLEPQPPHLWEWGLGLHGFSGHFQLRQPRAAWDLSVSCIWISFSFFALGRQEGFFFPRYISWKRAFL